MSAATSIEWCDRTWNPVTGCTKVSPGCKNCYAEAVAERFWAKQYPPVTDDEVSISQEERPRRFTDVWTHPDRLDEPLRWRKPARIFVNSMSDLFHEDVPDGFVDFVFATMAQAERHTFQVLTKRAERMLAYCTGGFDRVREIARRMPLPALDDPNGNHFYWPLPNVHLGVSVEDQQTADERIPLLLQTPAAVRFLSVEPLLGPVSLDCYLGELPEDPDGAPYPGRLHWVIVGGESGPHARPCDVSWIRSIVDQCKAAGVPCFVKQRGSLWYDTERREGLRGSCAVHALDEWRWTTQRDRKGGDMEEWPEDLRVREFPEARA